MLRNVLSMLCNVLGMLATSSASSTCFPQGPRSPTSKINPPTCCLISCEAKGVVYHQVSYMHPSVKSRLSFLTCTCLKSPWMTWPRPQPDPLSLEALTSYLKVIPLPTFIVMEGPLPRKDKLNSSAMKTVQLRTPLLTNPSLYIFYFIVEIILRTMVV